MGRKNGYYWVKLNGASNWLMGFWYGSGWNINGAGYPSTEVETINEDRIVSPDETGRKSFDGSFA